MSFACLLFSQLEFTSQDGHTAVLPSRHSAPLPFSSLTHFHFFPDASWKAFVTNLTSVSVGRCFSVDLLAADSTPWLPAWFLCLWYFASRSQQSSFLFLDTFCNPGSLCFFCFKDLFGHYGPKQEVQASGPGSCSFHSCALISYTLPSRWIPQHNRAGLCSSLHPAFQPFTTAKSLSFPLPVS